MPRSAEPINAQTVDSTIKQIVKVLTDLRQQGKTVSLRICPQCKSPRLRFLETYYDIGGVMGITPTKYLCPQCGYWSRVIIEATNEEITEAVLDDIIRGETATAQKLLKQLYGEDE